MRAVRALVSLTVTLSLCAAAAAATSAAGLRFGTAPKLAQPGDDLAVTVIDPHARDGCGLHVTYADGLSQTGLPAHATGANRLAWTWKVPSNVRSGSAKIAVTCKSGKISRPLKVLGNSAPPAIDVVKQGFSVKTSKFGGDSVSYGVLLSNPSKTTDALNVYVLVNFVTADNVLIGSRSTNVDNIRAGTEWALGNSLSFPGAAPVSRLEVVVRVGSTQLTLGSAKVSLADLRIVPGQSDATWVGEVDGQLTNLNQTDALQSATISGVVFDGAGNIVGGGYGTALGTVPSGARVFIKLTSGFTSVPTVNAASVELSVEPRFQDRG